VIAAGNRLLRSLAVRAFACRAIRYSLAGAAELALEPPRFLRAGFALTLPRRSQSAG
jgi:hypothetical protein